MKRAAFLLAIAISSTANAAESKGRWLRDHLILEWLVGTGAWRSSITSTERAPGFEELAGGSELVAGLDVWGPLGVVALGRFMAGPDYHDGTGGLALQVRVSDRVRLRAGPAAGELRIGSERGILVGGLIASSFDLIPFGGGRVALSLSVRFDVDGLLGGARLPASSLALAVGLGFRY